jgi:hypothetical protein
VEEHPCRVGRHCNARPLIYDGRRAFVSLNRETGPRQSQCDGQARCPPTIAIFMALPQSVKATRFNAPFSLTSSSICQPQSENA